MWNVRSLIDSFLFLIADLLAGHQRWNHFNELPIQSEASREAEWSDFDNNFVAGLARGFPIQYQAINVEVFVEVGLKPEL